jgi:tetratricopeptide (TPR) repeat protein
MATSMTYSIRSRTSAERCWVMLACLMAAGPPPALASPAPVTSEDRARAERLYRLGNQHYELGEYAQAIEHFRRSYQLAPEPVLLFDLAQAYRLHGDCRRSLETYRQFARLAPNHALRFKAQAHIEALQGTCGAAATSALRPAPDPKPRPAVQIAGYAALTAGVAMLLGAGGSYAWNHGRHQRWQQEDGTLASTATQLAPADAVSRQERNDRLLRSIARTDRLTLGMAVVGGTLTLSGASLLLTAAPADPERKRGFRWQALRLEGRW